MRIVIDLDGTICPIKENDGKYVRYYKIGYIG